MDILYSTLLFSALHLFTLLFSPRQYATKQFLRGFCEIKFYHHAHITINLNSS